MADKKISALTASTTPLAGTEVLPIVQGASTVKVSVDNLTAGRAVNALSATTTAGLRNTSAGSDTASTPDGLFLTDASNKNVIVQLGASGGLSSFVYEAGGAGWRRVAGLLTNGNSVVDVGNVVIGTAGKGIDFSATTHAAGMTSELLNDYEEGTWTPAWGGTTSNPTNTYSTQTGTYTKIGNRVTCWLEIATATTSGGSGNLRITGLPFTATGSLSLKTDYAATFLSNFPSGGVASGTTVNLTGTILANEQSYLSLANLQGTSYIIATISYTV